MLWAESFRNKEITTLKNNNKTNKKQTKTYETGTFHASSL